MTSAKELKEIAEAADAAYKAILTGQIQSYSMQGTTYTLLDLDKLAKHRKACWDEYNAASGGGFISFSDVSY